MQRLWKVQIELDKKMDDVEKDIGSSDLDTKVHGVG